MTSWTSAFNTAVGMAMRVGGRVPESWPSISSRNCFSTSRAAQNQLNDRGVMASLPWRARSSSDSSTCASRLMGIKFKNPAPPLKV